MENRMSAPLWLTWLDLFGTVVFAITGVLAADGKHLDMFGVIVLAFVTAVGGGTIRDCVMGLTPVFWVTDAHYLVLTLVAALVTFFFARIADIPRRMLMVADAVGLAVFAVVGAQKAISMDVAAPVVVFMGVMTAVVGGMIRDLLVGEIPLVLRREIYATAAMAGALVHMSLYGLTGRFELSALVAILVAFSLRMAAMVTNTSLPTFRRRRPR
jgi:uncharacterized membrane protein YeiH